MARHARHSYPLLPGSGTRSRCISLLHKQIKQLVTTAAAVPAGDSKRPSPLNILQVYSDPTCNRKFLALTVGQTLASIATLIHDSYLPIYVQDVLGLSNTKIGAVQGLAQFLCQLSKGASGVVGDLVGSQVRVLLVGMLLTLACKPMFPLLGVVAAVGGSSAALVWFFCGKLLDRMSKGIREAPTKALMNELAQESGDSPDAAYGLRQSLATAGALIGSGIAAAVFTWTGQNYIATFTAATIPPAIAMIWLTARFRSEIFRGRAEGAVGTKKHAQDEAGDQPKVGLLEKGRILVGAFGPAYWQALLVVAALYFARFDASFLTLRAKQVIPKTMIPLLFTVVMFTQTVLTAPLSKMSGQSVHNRNRLLLLGFLFMIAANTAFALPACATVPGMFLGSCLLGLHMALTHSITISMVASYMPTGEVPGIGRLSGTAVSFTDFLLGFVLAASNAVAGYLSDRTNQSGLGNVGCFGGGAVACCVAMVLLLLFSKFGQLGDDAYVVTRRKLRSA